MAKKTSSPLFITKKQKSSPDIHFYENNEMHKSDKFSELENTEVEQSSLVLLQLRSNFLFVKGKHLVFQSLNKVHI